MVSPSGVTAKDLDLPPADMCCRARQCRLGFFGRSCLTSDGLVASPVNIFQALKTTQLGSLYNPCQQFFYQPPHYMCRQSCAPRWPCVL